MQAYTRDLEKIFDHAIQYQVPLFQRPYVWEETKDWLPLWEDIEGLLNAQLRTGTVHPHFLGAAVLEQVSNPTGTIETRLIIDGQQRFTTLQIFMMVCRDHAAKLEDAKYRERFEDLVSNRESRIDSEDERCKLWPTNSDRAAYRLVDASGSATELEKRLKADPAQRGPNIVRAYLYFAKQLSAWFDGNLESIDGSAPPQIDDGDRMEAVWNVVRANLQLVVIDLDDQDEAQVIFETMNALGQPLLPADLIKNYMFRLATAEHADVNSLYTQFWAPFDAANWRKEVKQGRIKRPMVDIFINHYLALMTLDDVKSTHLFGTFKSFVAERYPRESELIARPRTVEEHMAMLARYGRIYRAFAEVDNHSRLGTFLRRLKAIDTTTVYPFLLLAYDALMPSNETEFDAILVVLESFLVRRMVCNLTMKNYNKLFIDLVSGTVKSGEMTAVAVSSWLSRGTGESQRFPGNKEFGDAILVRPIYKDLAQYKVRAILEAINAATEHAKSEILPLPNGLTIEHVMPQNWGANWPLPASVQSDAIEAQKATQLRDTMVNTLGNLTLITHSLNPALSNGSWKSKRPELLKFSKLNLTRYFCDDERAAVWDEEAILGRGVAMAKSMYAIWPDVHPTESAP